MCASIMEMRMENLQALTADGFDEAVIGYEPINDIFVYDRLKMVEIAMRDMDLSEEDAINYLEHSVWNVFVDEHTPIYISTGTLTQITNQTTD